MKVTRIKGFADLFSPESDLFYALEQKARAVFSSCGFKEVRTPILEPTELFIRSIGEETDVVNKEMYTLTTEKGRSYTLRPEATAGVMRAYIENALFSQEQISRLFTIGPMFRHERPQKGRFRQFHQINCECLGVESPLVDADMIVMLMRFLRSIGLKKIELQINSLGCSACRPLYKKTLQDFLFSLDTQSLCLDCQRRMTTNPLRVLDCKREECKAQTEHAPIIADSLCEECKSHFSSVLELLRKQNIEPVLNPRLVRGLDYYCRTTFEVVSGEIGSQSAVAGGGRYDGLVSSLGGPNVPGIGFACGMERLALIVPKEAPAPLDFFLLASDKDALPTGFEMMQKFRFSGLKGIMNYQVQSFKSLMRQADKSGARFCLILGSNELENGTVTIKSMRDGTQITTAQDSAAEYLATKKEENVIFEEVKQL